MSEHTTQEIKAIEAIEKELLTLAHAETKRWQRTSILMMEVEQNELWSLKDNAKSFTQWVKALAQKAGVHESNFWRCLKAGRFYLKISKISEMPGAGRDSVPGTDSEIPNTTNSGTTAGAEIAIPKIENLPPLENAEIAPETLELVEKITTAAPPEKAREIVKSALNGELSRQELRETWQTYRPAKAGNSRGKGTQKPAIDETKQTACSLIHTLANDDKRQTIRKNLCGDTDYKLFSEVAVETGTTRNKRRIDAVLVVNGGNGYSRGSRSCRGNRSHNSQSNKPYNRELQFIGVEIKVSKSDLINDQKYTEYAPFVHQLWLAVPPELVVTAQETAPDYVGILSIGSGPEPTDLSCSTGPSKTPETPAFVEIVKPARPSGTGESDQANNSLIYETAQTIIRHLVFR